MRSGIKALLGTVVVAALAAGAAFVFFKIPTQPPKLELTREEFQWLEKHATQIRVAPLPDSPPIDFIDQSGRHLGLTSDYLRLIEHKLGIRFQAVQCSNWKEILEKLKNHEIDLVGSVQNTPERREFLNFTEPYLSIPTRIITRKDQQQSFTLDTMQDLSIAIVEDSAAHSYILKQHPEYNLAPVPDAVTGFRKVSFSEVDAMVADLGVASYYIDKLAIANLRVAGNIDYPWELCLASRNDWPLLNSILNKTLAHISPDQRKTIKQEWITLSDTIHIPRELYIKFIGGILATTLLAASIVIFWNRTLRRQITSHSRELGIVRQSYAQTTLALDTSEERFRTMIEASNDMIWEKNPYGCFTYISPRVNDILGFTPEELIDQNSCSLMPPQDSARNTEALRTSTIDTVIVNDVSTYFHKDGRKIILESNGMAFSNSKGELAGFRGVSRDITERVQNERALRRSEERFRNLVETTSDWIWEIGTDGLYTYASPQAAELLGISADDLLGIHFTEHMPPAEAESTRQLFAQKLEQGAPVYSLVNSNRHKAGRTVVLETSAVPFYDKDWNIQGYRGISRDITDRVATEKQLEFERNLFRTFMKYAPDLIYFKDTEGRFIEVNDAKAKELNLSPEDLIGRSDFDFIPKSQAEERFKDDCEVMRTRNPIQKEEKTTTPNGERWHLTTKVPRYNEEGELVGTFGTSWDITDSKLAEVQLRQLRALLSNTIDSMPSVLVGVDVDGTVIQWNRKAETTTGLLKADALGKPMNEVCPTLCKEMIKVERAIRERKPQKEERIPVKDDGRIRYNDVTVYPLLEDGVEGAVIRIDDATDRVRIEEMMVQSEKMMSVGGLAAGMAHEINNPLAGILQNLQVMRNRITHQTPLNTGAAAEVGTSLEAIQAYMEKRGLLKMMDSISEAGRRAAKIVDNMLSFSRKDAAEFTLNKLDEIIERGIDLASNDYNLKKRFDFRHIKINREYESLPAIPCEGSQIQQVILNLLSNSAQAMADRKEDAPPPPQISVRLKSEKDMVLIEIEDNGPGMNAETRKRAFEPFFTTKEVGHGTGLGLSVSYFIITENHGGTMSLTSAPGRGTCFSIRIPCEHRTERWGLRL